MSSLTLVFQRSNTLGSAIVIKCSIKSPGGDTTHVHLEDFASGMDNDFFGIFESSLTLVFHRSKGASLAILLKYSDTIPSALWCPGCNLYMVDFAGDENSTPKSSLTLEFHKIKLRIV